MPLSMMDDPTTPQTLDDFEPEPDDHADAVFDEASEIAGLHVRLLIGITEYAYSHADDKDALDALKTVFHWNPRHMIRAYERFPEVFYPSGADGQSWENIVGCWTLGKVKDDEAAQKLYDDWGANTWDLAQLREAVKAANGTRERKPTLAERCAELVELWEDEGEGSKVKNEEFSKALWLCADQLAALPEVKRTREAKP